MNKLSIAVAIAALSGAAFAQQGIRVTSVTGTGTVASGSQATGISQNMTLAENSTVTMAKGGSVTIKFPNDCTAVVTDAAPFVVSEQSCKALLAKASGAGAGGANTGLMIAGGVLGVVAIHEATKGNGGSPAPAPISPAPAPISPR